MTSGTDALDGRTFVQTMITVDGLLSELPFTALPDHGRAARAVAGRLFMREGCDARRSARELREQL